MDRFQVLGKALRPPPDMHHGLSDVETRYRRRELDLIASGEARQLFVDRARIVSAVRSYLDENGFIEVETPVLQPLYGGALARPFTTHHNELDRDLYLRIATELYLKRLIVGGLERVYELGKDFRNEGVSTKHNPEFTMVEWYEAYADYEDEALRLEGLTRRAAAAIDYAGELDFSSPWRRVCFAEAIEGATGIEVLAHPDEELAAAIAGRGLEVPTNDLIWPQLADDLFSKYVEPTLREPPSCSTTRSRSRRSRASTAARRAWSSAGRRSRAAWRSPTPSASSSTPTCSASASRNRIGCRTSAPPRRCPTTPRSSRPSSRGCPPPEGSAWASIGW